jgi:hypothetical protein
MAIQMAEITDGCLWWRMALAGEVDSCVCVVRTWLLNSSSGGSVGALIHRGLHLLKELVDVHQVILGPQVW